jgi:hypothetical protein
MTKTLSVSSSLPCPRCGHPLVLSVTLSAAEYAAAPVADRDLGAYIAQVRGQKRITCPACAGE